MHTEKYIINNNTAKPVLFACALFCDVGDFAKITGRECIY